ncbi:MAG: hypothetical protein KatS3mg118_0806 [Paracoccaceae bacterium]|nr:MAG: hypothetical protein KatS3mg118_0806 [Paracoccaceae bacterium]
MKNVLLISIDDLFNYQKFRTKFGVEIQTPNLDRLAAKGTFFENGFAATPLCNPSRAAIMTGRSPFQTGVFSNSEEFYRFINKAETLPAAFQSAGYRTGMVGKVFHYPNLAEDFAAGILDERLVTRGLIEEDFGLPFKTGPVPAPYTDEDFADFRSASLAIEFLNRHTGREPFMLAVGFLRPHLPTVVPQEYFDLYPISSIVAAGYPDQVVDALPEFAKQFINSTPEESLAARIQGYLASITFVDAQLGRILDAMDAGGHWNDTTVLLFSDHGYLLGDHDSYGKFTLWEEAANAPLIVVDPDQDADGQVISTPVSLTQIFPTLTELAGIPTPDSVTTRSFAGLVDSDRGPYEERPVLTFINGSLSMRAGDYRLIRYEDGSLELYDLAKDPGQYVNLALDRANAALVADMIRLMREIGREEAIRFTDSLVVLNGNARDDVLIAGDDVGTLIGRAGDDTYFATNGTRVVELSGEGIDTLVLRAGPAGSEVVYRLPAHVENLTLGIGITAIHARGNELDNRIVVGRDASSTILGVGGNDSLFGSVAIDDLRGGAGGDYVFGMRDDDLLVGGGGDDVLDGGPGNDRLRPGAGDDVMTGGAGADVFVFAPREGRNVIAKTLATQPDRAREPDFDPATDKLLLLGFGFASATEAREAFFDTPSGACLNQAGTRIRLWGVSADELTDRSILLRSNGAGAAEEPTGIAIDLDTGGAFDF